MAALFVPALVRGDTQLKALDVAELAKVRAIVTTRGKFGIPKLDGALKGAVREVMKARGLTWQWRGKPDGPVRPLTIEPKGDVWFTLEIRVENGSCGALRGAEGRLRRGRARVCP